MDRLTRIAFFLVALSLLVLSGCGDGRAKDVYTIARDTSWYPMRLMGKEKNLLGFADELLFEIGKSEKFGIQFVTASSNTLFTQLNDKKYDAILTSIPLSSRQKEYYEVSQPIYLTGPVLLVHVNSEVHDLDELENQVIGVELGASVVFDLEHYPDLIISPYENILFALENLSNGQIDGVIMGLVPASVYTNSFYRGKLKIATAPMTKQGIRLVTLRTPEGTTLVEEFNEGLESLRSETEYQSLLRKWGLVDPDELQDKK